MSTTRRSSKAADKCVPKLDMPEYRIDSDAQPNPDDGETHPGLEVLPPMVSTGMKGTAVKSLRNAFEARAHTQGSLLKTYANAELRARQAVQECLHH